MNAIESLMKRRGAFDYILLETTGLADPGNIAPLFWVDDALGSSIYLDGIVTLVDAKNILLSLDERPTEAPADEHDHQGPHLTTAHLQISHADVVVINKSDLVSAEQLQTVALRIKAINSLAKIHIARYGQVPHLEGLLLDLHAYDKVGSLDIADKGHSHLDPVRWWTCTHSLLLLAAKLMLSQSISTTKIDFSPLTDPQLKLLDAWLRSVLWDSKLPVLSSAGQEDETIPTFEIHRLKGRIMTAAGSFKMIQGVREVFEITNVQEQPEQSGSTGRGKIVLIGRGLSGLPWQASMATALDATTNVFGDQPSMLDQ